jgi:predicted TIM-barrel fold metal-dependent hydrolase
MKRTPSIFFLSLALPLLAQTAPTNMPDPGLMNEINQLKAIDNHAHPPAFVREGEKDEDYDALPCDPLEPTAAGLMWREDNPIYLQAWKSLWGYKYDDATPEHLRELLATKKKIQQEQGENYPNWVLDQLGIETEFANRIALGRGQKPPRFRWVPFDDTLLFPLNNSGLAAQTPDRKIFFAAEGNLMQRYLKQVGVSALPPSLEEYEAKVVTPLLEQQRNNGAVAIKFEAAYLRSLDFAPAREDEARRIYAQHVVGDVPSDADYKTLQDYLFRYVAREAGRLNLAVHFHTGGGCGGYFYLEGSNPVLLESVFNDPSLRKTNFVLVHAGAGNFNGLVAYLLMKPNVYADISEQPWMTSVNHMVPGVRFMLEWYPEKVLFGTDLFPGTPQVDWEEVGYQTTHKARLALAEALTGMLRDGEITRQQATAIARMVMRENAIKLYGLSEASPRPDKR